MLEKIEEACAYIKNQVNFEPEIGIVLGTGLSALTKEVDVQFEIDYEDIPYFPLSTVEFHSGKLLFGVLRSKKVVIMKGRLHFYEGYNMQDVTFPIRVLKFLGIKTLFLSNACGGINKAMKKSDIMIINDHINLLPDNPLIGSWRKEFGSRFPDMNKSYDPELIRKGREIAKEKGIKCFEGVYAAVTGPNLETQAEYRYIGIIGGDAVGMSTIPEVLVARQMGIPVFAISCITDEAFPEVSEKVTIESVLAAAAEAEPKMTAIMSELIARL